MTWREKTNIQEVIASVSWESDEYEHLDVGIRKMLVRGKVNDRDVEAWVMEHDLGGRRRGLIKIGEATATPTKREMRDVEKIYWRLLKARQELERTVICDLAGWGVRDPILGR